jgi:hypothetical protein
MSARRRAIYLTTHKYSQQIHIYAPEGIRVRDFNKRVAADGLDSAAIAISFIISKA